MRTLRPGEVGKGVTGQGHRAGLVRAPASGLLCSFIKSTATLMSSQVSFLKGDRQTSSVVTERPKLNRTYCQVDPLLKPLEHGPPARATEICSGAAQGVHRVTHDPVRTNVPCGHLFHHTLRAACSICLHRSPKRELLMDHKADRQIATFICSQSSVLTGHGPEILRVRI